MNSKLNLIIDGNYLLHKCLIISKKRQSTLLLGQTLLDKYKKIRSFYSFKKVYLVNDRKNYWRRDVFPSYKRKEKQEDETNWEHVFEVFSEFKKFLLMDDSKVICLENESIEGDDWISIICEETNRKQESNLIVTRDSDIYQLLHSNIEEKWLNLMYDFVESNERYFVPFNFYLFLTEMKKTKKGGIFDIYNSSYMLYNFLEKLNKEKPLHVVDSDEELFIKILIGDARSDNIPSVLMRLGRNTVKKIYENYKLLYKYDVEWGKDEDIEKIANVILEFRSKNSTSKQSLIDNIKRNVRLISLDTDFFPNNVKEILIHKLYESLRINEDNLRKKAESE